MATKTNKALDNGASLIAVRDAAATAESGRMVLVATLRDAWARAKSLKPAKKYELYKDVQRHYFIGALCAELFQGDTKSDDCNARAGAIIDGTTMDTKKPKAGQHIRTAEEAAAFARVKVRFSDYCRLANIPTMKPDGTLKAKAERAPRADKQEAAPKAENLAAAAPKATTAQDCVTYYQTQAATWLAYANKNAATMPAGLAGLVLDVVNKMKAFKAD